MIRRLRTWWFYHQARWWLDSPYRLQWNPHLQRHTLNYIEMMRKQGHWTEIRQFCRLAAEQVKRHPHSIFFVGYQKRLDF